MIPLQLSLKNFLSYGSDIQTISFAPYHFICLSGKNGHGKSALLDAITWATWGQARKASGTNRIEEHLLHLSATEMLVIFEFIASEKQYRIKRGFVKQGSKGIASLEFGIIQDNDQIISLTGKTIRETQQTIIKEIGLDFETFLNSSFLRQGDANEFSKKTPKERKDLLGRILSLEYYESIKKVAHEKIKEYTTKKESLLAQQNILLQKQAELYSLNARIAENQEKRDNNDHQINNIQQQLTALTILHTKSTQDCWIITKTQETQQKYIHEQKKYQDLLRSLLKERKSIRQKQHRRQSIKLLLAQKELLLQHIFTQQRYLEEKITCEQELLKARQLLMITVTRHQEENQKAQKPFVQQQESLRTEQKAILFQIEQLKKEIDTASGTLQNCEKHVLTISLTIKKYEQQEAKAYRLVQRFQKRATLYQLLLHTYNDIKKTIQELELQHDLLEKKEEVCPLCFTALSQHTRQTALKNMSSKKESIAQKQLRLRAIIVSVKHYLETKSNRKTQYEALIAHKEEQKNLLLRALSTKEHTLSHIEKQQASIITLQHHSEKLEKEAKILEKTIQHSVVPLEQNTEYQRISNSIVSLESLHKSCQYNEGLHKQYTSELEKLQMTITAIEEKDYETKLAHINEQIHQICSQLRHIQKLLNEHECQQEKYESLQKKITLLESTITSQQTSLKLLYSEKEALLREQGIITSQKKQQEEIAVMLKQQETDIKNIKKDIDQYSIIAHMMGKDGIQALLVEQAIPEIEYEANAILLRLSNNEMHIFIESLKDLKSGKTKETLDIIISDAKGVRPYELFSGGEAFRIDLSLRIALSKLLAHRAGTTVETLIIDEGFGSQDEEGVSMVIDALYKIQSDFKKIIIVSHLSHLKEQIPVHFNIAKSASGSSVSITSS